MFVNLLLFSILTFGTFFTASLLIQKGKKSNSRCYRCIFATRFYSHNFVLRTLIITFLHLLTSSCINLYSFSLNSGPEALSSLLSVMLLILMTTLLFGIIDVFAEAIRRKKAKNFRRNYANVYRLFEYRKGVWKTLYYPLLIF